LRGWKRKVVDSSMKIRNLLVNKQMGEFPDVRSDRIAALEAQVAELEAA
jgi:hypothetical protein